MISSDFCSSSEVLPLIAGRASFSAYFRIRLRAWVGVPLQVYCCNGTPLAGQAPRVSTHWAEFSARRTRMPGTDERISNSSSSDRRPRDAPIVRQLLCLQVLWSKPLDRKRFRSGLQEPCAPGVRAQVCGVAVEQWFLWAVRAGNRRSGGDGLSEIGQDRPGSLPARRDETASPGAASSRTTTGERSLRKGFLRRDVRRVNPLAPDNLRRYAVGPGCARRLVISRVFALCVPPHSGHGCAAIGGSFGPGGQADR